MKSSGPIAILPSRTSKVLDYSSRHYMDLAEGHASYFLPV